MDPWIQEPGDVLSSFMWMISQKNSGIFLYSSNFGIRDMYGEREKRRNGKTGKSVSWLRATQVSSYSTSSAASISFILLSWLAETCLELFRFTRRVGRFKNAYRRWAQLAISSVNRSIFAICETSHVYNCFTSIYSSISEINVRIMNICKKLNPIYK